MSFGVMPSWGLFARHVKNLRVQDLRLYGRALTAVEVKNLATSSRLLTIVSKPAASSAFRSRSESFRAPSSGGSGRAGS